MKNTDKHKGRDMSKADFTGIQENTSKVLRAQAPTRTGHINQDETPASRANMIEGLRQAGRFELADRLEARDRGDEFHRVRISPKLALQIALGGSVLSRHGKLSISITRDFTENDLNSVQTKAVNRIIDKLEAIEEKKG